MSSSDTIENPDEPATLRVSIETWQRLNAMQTAPSETFEDVVTRLLAEYEDSDADLAEMESAPSLTDGTNIDVRRETRERLRELPGRSWHDRLYRLVRTVD